MIILSVIAVEVSFAQTGEIKGQITDAQTGEPIANVNVALQGTSLGAATSNSGTFFIKRVPVGEYSLIVSRIGYQTAQRTIVVKANEVQQLAIQLSIEPIEFSAIVVERMMLIGDRNKINEIPGSAHYLSREDLEAQRLLFDDVHLVLRQVPGINIQEEEGYGLRPNIGMRGTGSDRSSKLTLMEDGVLIAPAPYAAPAAYYFPVLGRMAALEVRKGSSQIKYGPRTIGGALNLISSKIPNKLRLQADIEGGQDTSRKIKVMLGDSHNNFGWLVETYQIATNGFKQLEIGADTGFDIEDYLVKLRLNSNTTARIYQEVEVKLGLTDELANETYLGLTDDDFDRNPNLRYSASQEDVMKAKHKQVQARYFGRPLEHFDITMTLYRNDFQRNWYKLQSVAGQTISDVLDKPDDFLAELQILRGTDSEPDVLKVRANNRTYYSQGLQSTIGLQFGGTTVSQEIELGIRYHEDQEDRFQHEDGFQMVGGRMVLTSRGTPGSQSNRVSHAQAWAFFLLDKVVFGKWLFTPGIRYETIRFRRTDYAPDDPERTAPSRVRKNGVNVIIPGVGGSYAVSPDIDLFAGVHKGFAPPGPGADEKTQAEKSINYEFGTRLRSNGLNTQLVGFFNDYSNILGRATLATGESGTGDVFNGGEVDVKGLELSIDYDPAENGRFPIRMPIRLAYTFTHAKFRSNFQSDYKPWGTVEAGDELPYVPRHQLYASIGLKKDRFAVNLAANYVSKMRTVAGKGPIRANQSTDDFVLFNLSGEYTIASWGSLFASVQNLMGKSYIVARRPAGARPGLPRTIMAGIKTSF
ncbi:MAG: TonB-dependent receptor domain-containing protein [bacterium]